MSNLKSYYFTLIKKNIRMNPFYISLKNKQLSDLKTLSRLNTDLPIGRIFIK